MALASVVGEERARDGLKRRAHESSRAMDGEARLSLARAIRVRPSCYCLAAGRPLLLVAQSALQNFADRRLRQLVAKLDLTRDLVARQSLATIGDELLLGQCGILLDDE